jgi:hypothetical protein
LRLKAKKKNPKLNPKYFYLFPLTKRIDIFWSLERALLPRPAAYKAAALLG